MDILFNQAKSFENTECNLFSALSITDCYVKRSTVSEDLASATKKRHHHAHFEIHIVSEGAQVYEMDGKTLRVSAGEFLLIAPTISHRVSESAVGTRKYALTFCTESTAAPPYLTGKTPHGALACIDAICHEKRADAPLSESVIALRAAECVLHFLRLCAALPEKKERALERDARVALAKSYIDDNVCSSITVGELAAYVYLSPKQLERLFLREEGVSVAAYVRARRVQEGERLLADGTLSIRQISERLGFPNEYYFNAFFKKQNGMTPGAYRKSVILSQ